MEINIRKATIEDVENIFKNRMDFLYQAIGKEPSEEFKIATKEYLYKQISSNTFVCHIATYNDLIISCVIICIYNVIPKPSNITGKIGYVFNVYMLKEFRGKGIATKLMEIVVQEARHLGVGELYLSTTDDGKGIYEKFNFCYLDKEMCLRLI